jgi:hypothetical protein
MVCWLYFEGFNKFTRLVLSTTTPTPQKQAIIIKYHCILRVFSTMKHSVYNLKITYLT